MAIYTGRMRQDYERKKEEKRLATEARKQEDKAAKRKGWSGLLGSVGGKVLGTALAGMTGGLAAPLLMAAGTFAGRKAAHELTRGMGADPSAIKSESKYGYGVEEAKTLREGLEQQMAVDPLKEKGGFGKDLISAYMSAGMSGELGGAKSFLKGGEGASTFKEALVGKDGWKGATGAKEALFGKAAELSAEEVIDAPEYTGLPFEQEGAYSPLHPQSQEPYVFGSEYEPEIGQSVEEPYVFGSENTPFVFGQGEEGGQVPTKDQLMALLMSARMQQQKTAYDDTPLEEVPMTIAEYFSGQGVSLGGSNKQSLSQMLGR